MTLEPYLTAYTRVNKKKNAKNHKTTRIKHGNESCDLELVSGFLDIIPKAKQTENKKPKKRKKGTAST